MIDFYAMGSPNVVKIYIALEEMGTLVFFPAGQGKYGKKSHRNRSRYQKRPELIRYLEVISDVFGMPRQGCFDNLLTPEPRKRGSALLSRRWRRGHVLHKTYMFYVKISTMRYY